MANVSQRIENLLVEHFAPHALSVMDDSASHAGHSGARAGGESHFTLTIVSKAFAGKSAVERHRMVYKVLQPLIDEGLHAITIKAETPDENSF